jgi:hypothetical protein
LSMKFVFPIGTTLIFPRPKETIDIYGIMKSSIPWQIRSLPLSRKINGTLLENEYYSSKLVLSTESADSYSKINKSFWLISNQSKFLCKKSITGLSFWPHWIKKKHTFRTFFIISFFSTGLSPASFFISF